MLKKVMLIGVLLLCTGCQEDPSAYLTMIQNGKEVFVNQYNAIKQIAIDHKDTIESLRQQFNLPPFTKESIPQYLKLAIQLSPVNAKYKALVLVLDKLGIV